MLLQNEKSVLTMGRDRASRILYDEEPMVSTDFGNVETSRLFNNDHNLEGYQQLVSNEYADKLVSEPEMIESPVLNQYMVTPKEVQPYQAVAPQFESYYTGTTPMPQQYQTYRPKVIESFPEVQIAEKDKIATHFDEMWMEKVAEAEVVETQRTAVTRQDSEVFTESYLRLNAKGLIACVTFFAVTALIIALVIINGIAIGASASNIETLQHENRSLQVRHNDAMSDRADAYNDAMRQIDAGGPFVPGQIVQSTPRTYGLSNVQSDHSTNLFDVIAKFLTSLFR